VYNLGSVWTTTSIAQVNQELVAHKSAAMAGDRRRLMKHARHYQLLLRLGSPLEVEYDNSED